MDREPTETVDLIDLGAASVETQGGDQEVIDFSGQQPKLGLSDD
ncbi:benenodin family lasso peptide [Sphingomonas sp. Y38-1Y]|nr:benenodin family lasso peptide [Sphingomonas sp. Y38-1Y]